MRDRRIHDYGAEHELLDNGRIEVELRKRPVHAMRTQRERRVFLECGSHFCERRASPPTMATLFTFLLFISCPREWARCRASGLAVSRWMLVETAVKGLPRVLSELPLTMVRLSAGRNFPGGRVGRIKVAAGHPVRLESFHRHVRLRLVRFRRGSLTCCRVADESRQSRAR